MPRAIHNVVADIERRYGEEGTAAIAARMRAMAHRMRITRECPTALDLAARFDPGLMRTPALEVVNARIHEAMNTRDGRLIVSMPPQSGKSNLVHWAIARRLLDNPEGRIGYASYAKWLARRGGRTVRDRIESHMGPGLRIKYDHRDAADWQIDGHIGGMYSVGIEGGFTGQPVDEGLVVDDPIKDLQDAQSPAIVQHLFDWWSTVAQTRVWAGAWIIIIQCVAEGERVLTATGQWVPIETVSAGDRVAALDDQGRLVARAVTASRCSGEDALVSVKTDRLSLKVNTRHPFAVLPRKGVRHDPGDVQWVTAGDLRVGDVVVTAKSAPESPAEARLPDGQLIDLDRAWLIGYMLGDGWVTRYTRKPGPPGYGSTQYAVCVALSDKPHFDERARKELERWAPTRVYPTSGNYLRTDWNAGGRVLHAMGLGAGAWGKRVPAVVWDWPLAHRREFLAGYAAADGSRLPRCRDSWRVSSVNRDLISDVRDLALTCGVRPAQLTSFTARTQPPNSREIVESVCWSVSLAFAQDQAEGRALILAKGKSHRDPVHIRYERVRSITPAGWSRVYDLTVDGAANFVAEGYVVHNTRWVEHELASVLIDEGWPWVNIPAESDPKIPDALGREPGVFLENIQGMTPEGWRKKRADVGEITWFAMYQGVPSPPKGDTFKLEWFNRDRVFERPPAGHPALVFVDPADNPGDGDEAGILVANKGPNEHLYLGPDYSGHYTVGRWIRVALLAVARHDAVGIVFEQSLSGLGRSITQGWKDLRKQALILRDLGVRADTPVDPEIIERAVAQLAHEHDPPDTVEQYRAELLELWPLVDAVLSFTPAGPQVRRIHPKGTKEWRSKAASPAYERREVHHVGYLAQMEHQMATWKVGQKSPDRMDTAVHAVLHLSGAAPAELIKAEGPDLPTRSTRPGSGRSTVLPRSTMVGRR